MNLEGVLVEDRNKDTLLSAGTVQVRITDWFFLKDKADIQYIALKDATIKFQRTDSVWNYQYLADYFSSPTKNKKKTAGIEFNLQKVLLENVVFTQRDAWLGSDLSIKLGALDMDARQISFSKKIIDVSQLKLTNALYHEFSYARKAPRDTSAVKVTEVKPANGLKWNTDGWIVGVGKLTVDNGGFQSDKGSLVALNNYFDGNHINFSAIAGTINNFSYKADTLSGLLDLSTKERSGLVVQHLKGAMRFNPEQLELKSLYLQTNRSILRDYYSMKYKNWREVETDFAHLVHLSADFDNSTISSDDIAFFAPELKTWKRKFQLDGKVSGTIDALDGKGVDFRSGNTSLQGNFSVLGLTNISEAYLNVEAHDLSTNYSDASTFFPQLRNVTMPNLRKLGNIRFTGTYTGFFKDFVAFGTLHTSLGSLQTDLNMKLPSTGVPTYSGNISTESFMLGQFFNNADMGVVDFHGNLKGRGFTWSNLDLDLNGIIHRIRYKDYLYQYITAKGRLNNKSFNGDFTIDDPNAKMAIHGLITFKGDQPTYHATATIEKANLKALQLSAEDLSLTGNFDLNFTGKNLADFMGTARITDATLLQNGNKLSFDSLNIASGYANGVRTFTASSNEFDAIVKGQFDLPSLPDAFTLFLSRYYPSFVKAPTRQIPNQAFTFDITTRSVEDYVRMVDKNLTGFDNSHISGSLNMAINSLTLDANIPQFGYKKYQFSDVSLKGDGNYDRLLVNGNVSNAQVGDSLTLPTTKFSILSRNDVSDVVINTTSNQSINQANLAAQVRTFPNGANIKFNPSTFILNNKTWSIEQGGELVFQNKKISNGHVILKESNQEISLSTVPANNVSGNDLIIALKNLNIGDFSPFITKKNRIEGLLNGNIKIEDPQDAFNVVANVQTDELRVDNDSIGRVATSLTYNKRSGILKAKGSNDDPEHQLKFDVDMNTNDSTHTYADKIIIQPINYPVTYLQNFIGGIFSDLKGYMTGQLSILGSGDNRKYLGKARLHEASLKVNFTQVTYALDDADISLLEDRIDFGTLKMRDRLGNTATVRGTIYHSGFKNMEYDMEVIVDKTPMEVLNTNYNNNQTFYGKAFGTGSFSLSGPQNALSMNIDLRASDRDSSYITLPPSKNRETGSADFMVERKYGREMGVDELSGTSNNINYVVNLTATPLVNVEVIMDELTGDVIKGRGNGTLIIESGTNQPLNIRGRYDIEEGSYLFTFQSFFKKPFILKKGANNYISWSGDPYAAQINFEAVYDAKNVQFTPLVNSLSLNDARLQNYRGEVYVVTQLKGDLFHPNFTFHIDFPENSPAISNPSFTYGIQQIEQNTNEINKQVTYLIVFNSFAPYVGQQDNTVNEFAYNTISGLLFGQVNNFLNQKLAKLLPGWSFNFSGSVYNKNLIDPNARGFKINQAEANVSISSPLLSQRIQITGTANVPVQWQSDVNKRFIIYPDISIDLLINKTGSVRATIFYSETPDITASAQSDVIRNQRAGVKLSYRKEFDSFADFFKKRKKDVAPDTTRSAVNSGTNK